MALGYSADAWETLEGDLRGHALDNEALATETSQFGQKYEVRGTLKGPAGKAALLVAVWIVLHGEDFPRLVTAYPGAKP